MKERTKQRIANLVAGGVMLVAASLILMGLAGVYMLADILAQIALGEG